MFVDPVPLVSNEGVTLFIKTKVFSGMVQHWQSVADRMQSLLQDPLKTIRNLVPKLQQVTVTSVNIQQLRNLVRAMNRVKALCGERDWSKYRDDITSAAAICSGIGKAFGFQREAPGSTSCFVSSTLRAKIFQQPSPRS